MSNIAAIDIGTNSLHLMVAEVLDDGSFRVLTREKEPVRLGSGGGDMKRLDDDAITRGVDALRRFAAIASQFDAPIHAYATSAVREARNRDDFVGRVRNEVGVRVEVISGPEEARLIHLGVRQAVAVGDATHLVVDIGGGSTEFVVAGPDGTDLLRSMKLGAIRLTDRFFPDGVHTEFGEAACRAHIRSALTPMVDRIVELDPTLWIASSGTAETLAVAAGDPERLPAEALHELTPRLLATKPEKRRSFEGIDERRQDIIAGGVVLLDEITRLCGVQEWTISPLALRAGIVSDLIDRESPRDDNHHLDELRRSSALAVARRYHEDLGHAEHVTDLALELFDELEPLHRQPAAARDLLEAAGLLHNIGVFVAHSAHHKHSQYLIRHDEQLAGFTDRERDVVSLVARYHRKSAPKQKHLEFAALDPDDQEVVRHLAAVLRIAIGLDRSGRRHVRRIVSANVDDHSIAIEVEVPPDVSPQMELHSARARSTMAEQLYGRAVTIDAVIATSSPPVFRSSD